MAIDIERVNCGRPPSALTRRRIEALAALVRAGLTPTAAARAIGVSGQTLQNWKRGGRGDTPNGELYRELVDAIEAALNEREQKVAQLIERARRHALQPSVTRAARR